jgi:hypothetical protein
MRLDFWNNPIVVSAVRVKNRHGAVFHQTAFYLMLLVAGGMLLAHYNDRFGGPWSRNYLLGLLGLQFVLASLVAISNTSNSLRTEVSGRTLDFQRIAALSPGQILLGKLLGEPTFAWMTTMATIPLAVWCWLLGVVGLSLDALVLIYVNLMTTTVLFGSLGLLQRVDAPASRTGGTSVLTVLLALVPFAFIPPLLAGRAGPIHMPPWTEALVGLLTPVMSFFGIAHGDPWRHCLSFYGLRIPLLLVTPVAQLAVSFLCFRAMERRLVNPLNTSLPKGTAYLVLLVVDLLAGGVFLEPVPLGLSLEQRLGAFTLVHLAVSYFLMVLVTPWRESLDSWVWRFRGRMPRLRDLWLGERSENGFALVTFSFLGVAALGTIIILPYRWQEGPGALQSRQALIASVMATLVVLTLSLGTLYQWLGAVAGRTGMGLFASLVLVLVVPCHVVGYSYQIESLLALTPSAQFAAWFADRPGPDPLPLFALYGAIGIGTWLALRRRLVRLQGSVDRKLESMGVARPLVPQPVTAGKRLEQ